MTTMPLKNTADTFPKVKVDNQCYSISKGSLFFGGGLGFYIIHGFNSLDNCILQPAFDSFGKLTCLNVIANHDMMNNTELFVNWGVGKLNTVNIIC